MINLTQNINNTLMRDYKKKFFLILMIANLLLLSCNTHNEKSEQQQQKKHSFKVENYKGIKNPRNVSQEWETDTSKYIIPLNELTVLLSRNKIKPLNAPRYINTNQAKDSLFGGQPVIGVEINGVSVAFPLNMLSYHEIVNDSIAGVPFSIAYCPLCNTAYAFSRKVNFKNKNYMLKFGTSGMLRMSNLVMWDEQTETWWQHIDGVGLVGKLAGAKLKILPSKIISLNNFIQFYPDGKVMMPVKDANYETHYTINNYIHYDSIGVKKPFLFFKEVDKRLPAMEYIISVENKNIVNSYPLSILQTEGVINNKVGANDIVLFYNDDMISNLDTKYISKGRQIGSGTVFSAVINGKTLRFKTSKNNFIDNETNSTWNFVGECIDGEYKGKKLQPVVYGLDFAFAWLAFHPESIVYKKNL